MRVGGPRFRRVAAGRQVTGIQGISQGGERRARDSCGEQPHCGAESVVDFEVALLKEFEDGNLADGSALIGLGRGAPLKGVSSGAGMGVFADRLVSSPSVPRQARTGIRADGA